MKTKAKYLPMERFASSFVKNLIRQAVFFYLDRLRLSSLDAYEWAQRLKKWPAIFAASPYARIVDIGDDLTIRAGLIDVIQRSLIVHGEWDPKVLSQLRHHLGEGDTFIDVGANIGYFSLLASRLVGDRGAVVAIEPSRRALSELASNVQRNNLSNIIILSVAAGRSFSIQNLLQATPNNIGASSLCKHIQPFSTEIVPVIPLDDIILPLGITPRVVKIDVEGFESNVLYGMKEILSIHRPVVICEVTPKWLSAPEFGTDLISFMQELGYHSFLISDSKTSVLNPINPSSISFPINFQEEVLFVYQSK